MSSTQRSRSAPSGDRGTFSESEDVQSSGLLTAERWRSTRERQPHHRDAFQGFSPEASNPTTQGITHVTNSTSSVAASEVAQGSELTAATNSSGASGVQSPWLRKTLLTLDGGGVRGFSSLLILRALMMEIATLEQGNTPVHSSVHPLQQRLRRPVRMQQTRANTLRRTPNPQQTQGPVLGPACASSVFLPAHYFDYIAGTSTGGLIAIMLGRLQMTVDECLEAYENLADHVFGHPRRLHLRKPPWIPRNKYNHRRLEEAIKDIVKERSRSKHSSTEFRQPNEDMCRTIVIAWQKFNATSTRKPHLFRSYHHPKSNQGDILERNPGRPDNYKIWEVGRATSAAPSYFKAVRLEEEDEKSVYIDGGFGANNPTEEVFRSVKQLSNNNPRTVQALVSIGTGKNLEADRNPSAGYGLYLYYGNTAAHWATQSEPTHERIVDATRDNADYCRLNVEHGLGKMNLDAWKGEKGCKTLELIRSKTQDYLDSPDVQRLISAYARQLVKIRKARSSQTYSDRWERFCHGVEYNCCATSNCPDSRDKRYEDRQALRRHVQEFHPSESDNLEELLNRCKLFPDETDPEEPTHC